VKKMPVQPLDLTVAAQKRAEIWPGMPGHYKAIRS